MQARYAMRDTSLAELALLGQPDNIPFTAEVSGHTIKLLSYRDRFAVLVLDSDGQMVNAELTYDEWYGRARAVEFVLLCFDKVNHLPMH